MNFGTDDTEAYLTPFLGQPFMVNAHTTIISQVSSAIALTIQAAASRTVQLTQYKTSAAGSLGNVSGGCIADVIADVSTTHTEWHVRFVANRDRLWRMR